MIEKCKNAGCIYKPELAKDETRPSRLVWQMTGRKTWSGDDEIVPAWYYHATKKNGFCRYHNSDTI